MKHNPIEPAGSIFGRLSSFLKSEMQICPELIRYKKPDRNQR